MISGVRSLLTAGFERFTISMLIVSPFIILMLLARYDNSSYREAVKTKMLLGGNNHVFHTPAYPRFFLTDASYVSNLQNILLLRQEA